MSKPLDTTVGEINGTYLGYLLLTLGLLFVPSSIFWAWYQIPETLEEKSFKNMWGPCYEGVSVRNNWSRAYYMVYIFRRFVFITIGLFITNPVFQIMGLIVLNYSMTIYYGASRPQNSRFNNRLELFNEFFVNICCMHLLFFTEAVPIET